jgi:hypothetical protein
LRRQAERAFYGDIFSPAYDDTSLVLSGPLSFEETEPLARAMFGLAVTQDRTGTAVDMTNLVAYLTYIEYYSIGRTPPSLPPAPPEEVTVLVDSGARAWELVRAEIAKD